MLNTFEGLNIDKAAKCLFKELMTVLLYTFIKRHLCTIHFKVTLQNRCSTMLKKKYDYFKGLCVYVLYLFVV